VLPLLDLGDDPLATAGQLLKPPGGVQLAPGSDDLGAQPAD
jgi:hypothetical protein